MATQPDDFEFEIEDDDEVGNPQQIEIEDDTPEADRGREPMPKEIVDELEADELEEYSEKVKLRLKQMKKVWHDERREKEREAREKAEALTAAQRLLEENRQLKNNLSQGEQTLVGSIKQNAEFAVEKAKREYREAYEAGDSERLADAQEKLSNASYKLQQITEYRPTLQAPEPEVQQPLQQVQPPRLDAKTVAWQERNTWYGSDPEMTAAALGLHQKLINERGAQYAGTDEYWGAVDTTMRRRFPDYFGEEVAKPASRESKPPTVVAPASRSRSAKKIVLTKSQLAIAKKFGLTPEQYAREVMKTEN
jgi:hypothetical protein